MIERKFVLEKVKEFQIKEFISQTLKNIGHSNTTVQRTPLGEKIVIKAARPGLVVGRKGDNIKKLTITLKKKFKFENPQIEIEEVKQPMLDAQIVAERIASNLEKFGLQKFKGIGHKTLQDVMDAKARGIEIIISGKVPSKRARSWRFYKGYLKKSGEATSTGIRTAYATALLKTGIIGIQVRIMPPDLILPDDVTFKEELIEEKEEPKKKKKETKKPSRKKIEKAKETKKTIDKDKK
ncbi:30S ribosomal protein S3 [Candidatus Woesearchaeota archaeon CG10_big_fil_rev_8_21_14_0_10_30_7]|nr:MAG: 30S ribosomal protein S3 [Candidatus Woesearchaeota archaeon CG10_big_fil_rev_8_21_14_0_10_30_7]